VVLEVEDEKGVEVIGSSKSSMVDYFIVPWLVMPHLPHPRVPVLIFIRVDIRNRRIFFYW